MKKKIKREGRGRERIRKYKKKKKVVAKIPTIL